MTSATLTLSDTTVGKKVVMATSGVVLFGFSVVHMLGNMQIFVGREVINSYHVLLYGMPALLWGARAVLLLALVAHAVSAMQLARLNRSARPQRYHQISTAATSYAARTMVVGGVILLLYLIHHIAHMTVGYTAGLAYAHDHVDVYANLVNSYRHPWMAGLSVTAALVFGSHVYHGAWSLLQTLGVNHKRYNGMLRSAAMALAIMVTLGYVAVPIAVVSGLVR
jgi:succinate dehydrogenase / fumarate reductase cytochrome b subunit